MALAGDEYGLAGAPTWPHRARVTATRGETSTAPARRSQAQALDRGRRWTAATAISRSRSTRWRRAPRRTSS